MSIERRIHLYCVFDIIVVLIGQEKVLGFHVTRNHIPAKHVNWTHVKVLDQHWIVFICILLYLLRQRPVLLGQGIPGDSGASCSRSRDVGWHGDSAIDGALRALFRLFKRIMHMHVLTVF